MVISLHPKHRGRIHRGRTVRWPPTHHTRSKKKNRTRHEERPGIQSAHAVDLTLEQSREAG